MQHIKSIILLILITTISSCQFNQSVNTDLTTGAYSRGDGIGVHDVIIEVNGETDNRNEFVFGEKVNLAFNNISGLINSDGKIFPELSLHIVRNEKDTILSNPNLLENLKNGTDLSPLQLNANFSVAFPNHNNEKYKLFIQIRDRKGDGKFHYELPFTVTENDLLDITSNGIEYSTIYLWNETLKQPLFDKNVNSEHLYILILNGIKGLELTNEKVFPLFSIDLIDNDGNKILSDPNLLSAYEEVGVSPEALNSQVTAKLTFSEKKLNNPCRLNVKFKDKNSSKEINISTELNIN